MNSVQNVQITIQNGVCRVESPYNSSFVALARRLAGKWDGTAWVFDTRDLERVREACRTYYGSDGLTSDTCTLRVTFTDRKIQDTAAVSLFGRVIAKASGRDSGARWGDGVICLRGECDSSGSWKNWYTVISAGTVVLVRDFPRIKAEELVAKSPDEYAIQNEGVDREALCAERQRLLARVAEIDVLLTNGGTSDVTHVTAETVG